MGWSNKPMKSEEPEIYIEKLQKVNLLMILIDSRKENRQRKIKRWGRL